MAIIVIFVLEGVMNGERVGRFEGFSSDIDVLQVWWLRCICVLRYSNTRWEGCLGSELPPKPPLQMPDPLSITTGNEFSDIFLSKNKLFKIL